MGKEGPLQADDILSGLDIDSRAFAFCAIACEAFVDIPPLDDIEVHLVLAGELHLRIEHEPPIVLQRAGIAIVPPGRRQRLAGSSSPIRKINPVTSCIVRSDGLTLLEDDSAADEGVMLLCGRVSARLGGILNPLGGLSEALHCDLPDELLVQAAIPAILAEWRNPKVGSRTLLNALIKACVIILLRRASSTGLALDSYPALLARPLIARAVAAVIDDPGARHSVASLAAISGMSRSRFAQEFIRVLESTPMAFVTQVRLSRARELLSSTDLPVSAIAGDVGYSSRSHFSRSFRESLGVDPTQYRAQWEVNQHGR